jgi:ParB/RepB/Spo0J family partition protein
MPDGKFDMRAGARRLMAARLAGLTEIPAIVVDPLSDEDAMTLTVIENLQRKDLNPYEEADGILTLKQQGMTVKDIAHRIGRSPQFVARRIALASLPEETRAMLDKDGKLHGLHLRIVEGLACYSGDDQERLADALIQRCYGGGAGSICFSTWEQIVQKMFREMRRAHFDTKGCRKCKDRTGSNADLFGHDSDYCLNSECWQRKVDEKITAEVEADPKLLLLANDFWKTPTFMERKTLNAYQHHMTDFAEGDGDVLAIIVDGNNAGQMGWIKPPVEAEKGADDDDSKGASARAVEEITEEEMKTRIELLNDTVARIKNIVMDPNDVRDTIKTSDMFEIFAALVGGSPIRSMAGEVLYDVEDRLNAFKDVSAKIIRMDLRREIILLMIAAVEDGTAYDENEVVDQVYTETVTLCEYINKTMTECGQ